MKKMMHMIFSFSLSFLIFASNICLAARPMTEQERDRFASEIKTYFSNNFIKRIGLSKFFKDCTVYDRKENKFDFEKIAKFIDSFVTNNNKFDEEQGLLLAHIFYVLTGQKSKSFKEVITLYYNHISNRVNFLEQPLCCRALSAYILHKLIEMKIECKYVKYTVSGNIENYDEDHDAVAYKVEDKWYVCDLMLALTSEILRNCCKNPELIGPDFANLSFAKLLKMPIDEYKKIMNPGDTWDETDVTPEILNLDYGIVSNHNNTFSKLKKILEAQQKQ